MARFKYVNLSVPGSQWDRVGIFYQRCGFVLEPIRDGTTCCVFPQNSQSAGIQFEHSNEIVQHYRSSGRTDVYWKVGLNVASVDLAAHRVTEHGADLGLPRVKAGQQFLDVGFLTHCNDPAGYEIELLQKTFEASFKGLDAEALALQPAAPLGQDENENVLGMVTIRSSDINRSLDFYVGTMGMKLLCVEAVEQYGFKLYFLGFTAEEPPRTDDLQAIENREWAYQRPYTLLEIQARATACERPGPHCHNTDQAGFEGLTFEASEELWGNLSAGVLHGDIAGVTEDACMLEILDPDGIRIVVERPAKLS